MLYDRSNNLWILSPPPYHRDVLPLQSIDTSKAAEPRKRSTWKNRSTDPIDLSENRFFGRSIQESPSSLPSLLPFLSTSDSDLEGTLIFQFFEFTLNSASSVNFYQIIRRPFRSALIYHFQLIYFSFTFLFLVFCRSLSRILKPNCRLPSSRT